MGFTRLFFIVVLTALIYSNVAYSIPSFPALDNLKPSVSAQVQQFTVQGLVKRLVANRSAEFEIVIDPTLGPSNRATFRLESIEANRVKVTGNTGVAASLGFYHYLKYWAGCHVSWSGNQLNLPSVLPKIITPVQITTNDQFRYYQNVCTVSYSSVWWQWERWEQEIDWMALNGINLPLAFTGQEALWTRVYKQLGFNDSDLASFFTGPAFLAWNRMGNVDGWAGPLSSKWQQKQLQLQHLILQRMRAFGMIPVLPAFSGHVPRTFNDVFPEAKVTQLQAWGRFNETYCCTYLLDPQDPLFLKIGNLFLLEMVKEFNGTDHIYNCDVFNEMTPTSGDPNYLSSVGKAVFKAMQSVDKNAVWLMQGWLFVNDPFWNYSRAEALLTSVPLGRMLILDLQAELSPVYKAYNSYFGQPFIWCMLHNFGGVLGLYGAVESVNTGPFIARDYPQSTMVGLGLTPEGIEQNYAMYQFMNEMAWLPSSIVIDDWFVSFATQRYGGSNSNIAFAWRKLAQYIYNCTDGHKQHGGYIITKRPNVRMTPLLWYPPKVIFTVWQKFLLSADQFANVETFIYDLVDVTRECLQTIGNQIYSEITQSFKAKNETALQIAGDKMQSLLTDLDAILATNRHFLLGKWLEDAKAYGDTPGEKDDLEYNARNQITLWGPSGNIVDYAAKQWSGMFSHYYSRRWKLFVTMLNYSLSSKTRFNSTQFKDKVFSDVEEPFTFSRTIFPITPTGDTIQLSNSLYKKWTPQIDHQLLKQLRRKYLGKKLRRRQKRESNEILFSYMSEH